MLKVQVNKAAAIDPNDEKSAVKSITIVIDKEFVAPNGNDIPGEKFYKVMDKMFNDQAMQIAEALQKSLPGGTWDRLVGIIVRRHASYLVVGREARIKEGE